MNQFVTVHFVIIPIYVESIPRLYKYYSEEKNKGAMLVLEFLGDDLLTHTYRCKRFSVATVMKIGLQAVSPN